jgi:hypothetical protein
MMIHRIPSLRAIIKLLRVPRTQTGTGSRSEGQEPTELEFTLLAKEYELAVDRVERADDRIVQIVGLGFGFFASALVFLADESKSDHLPLEVAVMLPFFVITFYAILVHGLYSYFEHLWLCRALSERINRLCGKQVLIRFAQTLPSSRFFSFSTGNPRVRSSYRLLEMLLVLLFIATVVLALRSIVTDEDHLGDWKGWGLAAFFVIYGVLTFWAWSATLGINVDMARTFQGFISDSSKYVNKLPPLGYTYPPYQIGVLKGSPKRTILSMFWVRLGVFRHYNYNLDVRFPTQDRTKCRRLRLQKYTLVRYAEGGSVDDENQSTEYLFRHRKLTGLRGLSPGTIVAIDYAQPHLGVNLLSRLWRLPIRQIHLICVSQSKAELVPISRNGKDKPVNRIRGKYWPKSGQVELFISYAGREGIGEQKIVGLSKVRADANGQFEHSIDYSQVSDIVKVENLPILIVRMSEPKAEYGFVQAGVPVYDL